MSLEKENNQSCLDIESIMKTIPHRYPFLLVDRVQALDIENRSIKAVKNVTINEPFFQGHFPGFPVMPGVLIVEALAQAGAVLALTITQKKGKLVYLAGIDKARFKKPVRPGDELQLNVKWTRQKGTIGWARAEACVKEVLVAYAEIMFAFES